jgi:hypothetical protein
MAAVETAENPAVELDEDALLADFDATLSKKKKKKKKKVTIPISKIKIINVDLSL